MITKSTGRDRFVFTIFQLISLTFIFCSVKRTGVYQLLRGVVQVQQPVSTDLRGRFQEGELFDWFLCVLPAFLLLSSDSRQYNVTPFFRLVIII